MTLSLLPSVGRPALHLSCRSGALLLGLLLVSFFVLPARAQSVGDMVDRIVTLSERPSGAGKQDRPTFASADLEAPLHGIVLRGTAADTTLKGWVRFEENGLWDDWKPLYIVFSATSNTFLAAYRSDTLRTPDRFELQFSADSAADVELHEAGTFDDRSEADVQPEPAPGAAAPFLRSMNHITPPYLIRRDEWGAQPFIGDTSPLSRSGYRNITLHHAAGFGAVTLEEGLEQVRRIQEFHQNGRGWSDIGYHFVVDQSGRVYQGRPFEDERQQLEDAPDLVLGAHVGGANTANIGLCLLGCYHPPEGPSCADVITPAALDSVVTMFAFFSEAYGISPDNIFGHRDFSATACPGDNNYVLLDEIKAGVQSLLLTGNQPVGRAELSATVDEDGVVQIDWAFIADNGIVSYRIERAYLDGSTVIQEGTGAAPGSFVDDQVTAAGPVAYRLYATDQFGREQLLAAAEATVLPLEDYALTSNFPNPFEDQTTIRYFLPRDGFVRLRVYDVTGREVAVLVDTYQVGGQWHYAQFDGSGLASGTYFYRLSSEGFSGVDFQETRRMVRLN